VAEEELSIQVGEVNGIQVDNMYLSKTHENKVF